MLTMVSCDAQRGHASIRLKHPEGEITKLPGSRSYSWLVRDPDGSVYDCYCDGNGPAKAEAVRETLIFKPNLPAK